MKKQIATLTIVLASLFSFGQTWQAVGPVNGQPYYAPIYYSFASYNDTLYIGSEILSTWDGTNLSGTSTGISSAMYLGINALQTYNGLLYVGGQFDSAGTISANNVASWNGSVWSKAGNGVNGYNPYGNYYLNAMDTLGGDLYVGGYFDTAGSFSANNIAMWNGSEWINLGSGVNGLVNAITVYNNNIIAAGQFDTAGGIPANSISSWNGTKWTTLGAGITNGEFYVNALCVYNGLLIAAGEFSTAGGISVSNIAAWNGSTWSSLGSGIDEWVYSLAVYNGVLYAGGSFGSAGGVSVNNIAAWNGTTWSSVGGGIDHFNDTSVVYALTVWNGSLYAGGYFNSAGGKPVNNIAQWTTPAGINELSSPNSFSVYPNPSTGIFTVKSSVASSKSSVVEVYNMLGEKVYSHYSIPTTQYQIDLSSQSSGIYLYRIIGNDGTCVASGKLVKE